MAALIVASWAARHCFVGIFLMNDSDIQEKPAHNPRKETSDSIYMTSLLNFSVLRDSAVAQYGRDREDRRVKMDPADMSALLNDNPWDQFL